MILSNNSDLNLFEGTCFCIKGVAEKRENVAGFDVLLLYPASL